MKGHLKKSHTGNVGNKNSTDYGNSSKKNTGEKAVFWE